MIALCISALLLILPINALNVKRERWEKTNFLWDFGLITSCTKGVPQNPELYFEKEPSFDVHRYANLQAGDTAWVHCRFIPQFCEQVLPSLRVPIVLVIADGDETFPADCGNNFDIETLLNNPYIVHVFAQNNDYRGASSKVSSIPIGMDFHTIAYKGINGGWGEKGSPQEQEAVLTHLLKTFKPTSARKKRIFVDFHLADTMHGGFKRYLQFGEDRTSIFKRIAITGLVDYSPTFMPRSKLWAKKGEYAFSVSPHGNGIDCHRTWEDLVLGCIVIVKTSSLDCLYKKLPVVIVNDWSEITEQNLDVWMRQFHDAFTNPLYRQKLTNQYWINVIQSKVATCKNN